MIYIQRLLALMLSFILVGALSAQETRLQVVASHSILGDVIAQVADDNVDLAVTMPRGADPHAFEPSPSDLTALARADVVFVNGALFEEGLLEAIENAGDDMQIVEASSCVTMIGFSDEHHDNEHGDDEHSDDEHGDDEHSDDEHGDDEHSDDEHGDDEHSDDEHGDDEHSDDEHGDDEHSDDEHGDDEHSDGEHDDDCAEHIAELADFEHQSHDMNALGVLHALDCGGSHDDEHDEAGDAHDHGACDPHVWMLPYNVMLWTLQIRDTLSELDPANAEVYAANAAAYVQTLDSLQQDVIDPLIATLPPQNRVLVTSHDALGYLAAAYDFEIVTTIIPGGSTAAEPSTRDVAAVIDIIRAEDVPAIFGETTVSDAVARTIATETGAELVVLYTGSLSAEGEPAATYVDYIRYNYTAIVEALGGGL